MRMRSKLCSLHMRIKNAVKYCCASEVMTSRHFTNMLIIIIIIIIICQCFKTKYLSDQLLLLICVLLFADVVIDEEGGAEGGKVADQKQIQSDVRVAMPEKEIVPLIEDDNCASEHELLEKTQLLEQAEERNRQLSERVQEQRQLIEYKDQHINNLNEELREANNKLIKQQFKIRKLKQWELLIQRSEAKKVLQLQGPGSAQQQTPSKVNCSGREFTSETTASTALADVKNDNDCDESEVHDDPLKKLGTNKQPTSKHPLVSLLIFLFFSSVGKYTYSFG